MQVGDEVYVVYRDKRRGPPFFAKIKSIGRKWVTIDHWSKYRFDKETMRVDGGQYSSPATVYLSAEEYEATTGRTEVWNRLFQIVHNRHLAPEHLSSEDIKALIEKITDKKDGY